MEIDRIKKEGGKRYERKKQYYERYEKKEKKTGQGERKTKSKRRRLFLLLLVEKGDISETKKEQEKEGEIQPKRDMKIPEIVPTLRPLQEEDFELKITQEFAILGKSV